MQDTDKDQNARIQARGMLTGRRIAVTGGAGAIGAAIARHLVALGARVFVLDLAQPAQQVAGTRFVQADVTRRETLDAARAEIEREGGSIDGLVNCHGFQIRRKFEDYTEEEWARVVDVNFSGVFRSCQAFGPALREHGGSIVNISSVVGTIAARTGVAYGASKAAVSHLSRVLAVEWAPKVRVNAVAPGVVSSPLTAELFANPEYAAKRMEMIPMKRIAEPEDIAGPVGFLLSDHAAMMTGQVLIVDGGFSLQ